MNILSCLRVTVLTGLLALASISGLAQPNIAPAVAREGFWVVEWTPQSRQCIVRFYNGRQQLIYQKVMDRSLNVTRRQTKQRLNMALEQAMYVWNPTHQMRTGRQWVAIQFDKR